MSDIVMPDYLTESEDTIHERLLDNLPDDISPVEGDIGWDMTKPTAIEIARTKKITLQSMLKQVFVQYATKNFLDLLGNNYGVERNLATKCVQNLTIVGTPGTIVATGKVVTTAAANEGVVYQYSIDNTVTVPSNGTIVTTATCLIAGTVGNIEANQIIKFTTNISGVTSVTNTSINVIGTNDEDDESYRERILYKIKNVSNTGTEEDYISWTNEVAGIGSVKVKSAAPDDPLHVTVTITDENMRAATQTLLDNVETHLNELRPMCCNLTVQTVSELSININSEIVLDTDAVLSDVESAFELKITEYLKTAEYVSPVIIGAILLQTGGVSDYNSLTVNEGTTKISLSEYQIAIPGTITLTEPTIE